VARRFLCKINRTVFSIVPLLNTLIADMGLSLQNNSSHDMQSTSQSQYKPVTGIYTHKNFTKTKFHWWGKLSKGKMKVIFFLYEQNIIDGIFHEKNQTTYTIF
jgi:hypothetical protein